MSRDKADTLLLLTACTLVLAPHIAHLPVWISCTFPLILFWRGWITFRGMRMPPRWLLLPIAVLTMGEVYWTFKTLFGRDAGVAMLVLLLTCKLLEMHAKRDLFVVIFLSFFLMLSNFFYSQSIGTALMTILALIGTLTAQLSFQYTGLVPPLKQRLRLSVFIFVLAAPLTLVCFLLFPRIQGPLWGLPGDAHGGRTGMSDSMKPGSISDLALSDDIAFRAHFIDSVPVKSKRYWRGVVLGKYDGQTWTQLQLSGAINSAITLHTEGTPVNYQVTLEPNGHRWLFVLEMPQAAPLINGTPSNVTHDVQLLSAEPINERLRYNVTSYTDFILQADAAPSMLDDWLVLPQDFNLRTLAFAQSVQTKFSDPSQMINAVLRFFREEKFIYTLQPPLLGKDAVDDFLFSTRAGFCEHYASAFVVLMRAMGIPARVVTGYQGGEINNVDGFMTVRQSDAHAWAEVWLPKRGWVRVDPTAAVAPERVEMNLTSVIPRRPFGGLLSLNLGAQSWIKSLNLNWEALGNSWNQWVLNYTPSRQKNLLQSLGFKDVDWQTLTILMFVCGLLVTAAMALPLVIHRPKIAVVDALYSTFCKRMGALGCAREIYEGPQAYGARLAEYLPLEMRDSVAQFIQMYSRVRYEPLDRNSSLVAIAKLKKLNALHR